MGLTWIDHDTIEKPIEEIAADPDETKLDFDFTVETLKCTNTGATLSAADASGVNRRESVMGRKVKKICSKVK